MSGSNSIIMFLVIILIIMGGGMSFVYFNYVASSDHAVKCKNDGATISFLIDDEAKSVIMAGKVVSPETIVIFNETAISAAWRSKVETTKIFLDRIAGRLEIETSLDNIKWTKDKFECSRSSFSF